MSNDRIERMTAQADGSGKFGYQPIEKRGHQPVSVSPRDSAGGGSQPTTSQTGTPPSTPPTQGTSAKK